MSDVLDGAADDDTAYESVILPDKIKLQLAYVDHHNLWVDLRIVASTMIKIFLRDWIPTELVGYPTFVELRQRVKQLAASDSTVSQAA